MCQRWAERHGFDEMKNEENYCRNPDNSEGPWCYTKVPGTRWEFCDIPYCVGKHIFFMFALMLMPCNA